MGLDGPSQDGVRSAYVTVECLQKYVCLWEVTLDISVVNENGKAYSALVVTDEGLDEDEVHAAA